jgi:hypothetical protein
MCPERVCRAISSGIKPPTLMKSLEKNILFKKRNFLAVKKFSCKWQYLLTVLNTSIFLAAVGIQMLVKKF